VILATVGASQYPFDRLLEALAGLDLGDELVLQHGPSRLRPPGARCVEFAPFEALCDYARAARAVVTHAGVGSIMLALSSDKTPIVVPRLRRFGETVDDHQLVTARRLEEAKLVVLVEDTADLGAALADAGAEARGSLSSGSLGEELRDYLADLFEDSPADQRAS
jgi:UDP-N-acetylglucosamine transferase subunit ALG13